MAILSFSTFFAPDATALTSFLSLSPAGGDVFFFFIFLSNPDMVSSASLVTYERIDAPALTADRTFSLISLLSSRYLLSSNLCFFFASSSTSSSARRLLPADDDSASLALRPS